MKSGNVFETLEPLLVKAIPQAVGAAKVPQPLCCVRVYYYDTHAPCTYLLIRTSSKKYRAKMLADDMREEFWSAVDDAGDGMLDIGADPPAKPLVKIVKLFEQVYELLSESEEEHMPEFQQMLRNVCIQLNDLKKWAGHCEVTEDFVIAPADGSRFFGGDEDEADIEECAPADRLELLRTYDIY